MQLNGSLEDNILTLLCWSDEHAVAVSMQIAPELFSTKAYRKIAAKALEHLAAYSRAPAGHIRDLLEDDLRRGDDGKLLSRVLQDMEALQATLQPAYVLSQLAGFIALRRLKMALADASEAADRGDIEAAERALLERDTMQSASPGIWLHHAEDMLRFLDIDESDWFPSGIDELDNRGVRPARKTLFLMIGAKGVGKSWWCIDMGKAAIMNKKAVLHITLENSEEETAKRYTQSIMAMGVGAATTIRYPVFRRDALGRFTSIDFDERVAEGVNAENRGSVAAKLGSFKNRSRLLIKEFPTGVLTIPQLNAYLDTLAKTENFRPDLMIVDSGNKLAFRGEHIRADMGRNFTLLRGMGVARNMAVASTTHSNRSGDIARTVTGAAHVGEDYSMLGTADVVCTISKSAWERENGICRILVDKSRTSADRWMTTITQSYATGQFALDSIYHSKHVADEIDRRSGEDNDDED